MCKMFKRIHYFYLIIPQNIQIVKYIFKPTFISALTSPSPIIHHLSLYKYKYISINNLPNKNIKNNTKITI